jgi:hypothetical protein
MSKLAYRGYHPSLLFGELEVHRLSLAVKTAVTAENIGRGRHNYRSFSAARLG